MRNQLFEHLVVPIEGQRRRGARITCGHCGVGANVATNSFKGASDEREERFITHKFEKEGWKIGSSSTQHRCPSCFNAIKFAAIRKKEQKMADNVVAIAPKAEEPRKMSRDDRRIIFEKLQEIYVDEKTGYAEKWNDYAAAADLGVPVAWVKLIRDENFGPEGANNQIRESIQAAQELLSEAKKIGAQSEPLMTALRTILNRADKIERDMASILGKLR